MPRWCKASLLLAWLRPCVAAYPRCTPLNTHNGHDVNLFQLTPRTSSMEATASEATASEVSFTLEYKTCRGGAASCVWSAIGWEQLFMEHEAKLHVYVLSDDGLEYHHLHGRRGADANLFTADVRLSAAGSYLVVVSWVVDASALGFARPRA